MIFIHGDFFDRYGFKMDRILRRPDYLRAMLKRVPRLKGVDIKRVDWQGPNAIVRQRTPSGPI